MPRVTVGTQDDDIHGLRDMKPGYCYQSKSSHKVVMCGFHNDIKVIMFLHNGKIVDSAGETYTKIDKQITLTP